MKRIEFNKLLFKCFGETFKSKGFKKWKYGYVKEYTEGYYIKYGWSDASYDNSIQSYFYISIGLFKVGSILKKLEPENFTRPENLYPVILNLGQRELFELKKYPILKYDIYTEEDVHKMVNEVSQYFISEALPYLESVSDIHKLEQITNTGELNPRKKDVGLILAKLVNNPEYENLKNKYRELLKDWSDWDKQELEKVISFLDSHSQKELQEIAESSN